MYMNEYIQGEHFPGTVKFTNIFPEIKNPIKWRYKAHNNSLNTDVAPNWQ